MERAPDRGGHAEGSLARILQERRSEILDAWRRRAAPGTDRALRPHAADAAADLLDVLARMLSAAVARAPDAPRDAARPPGPSPAGAGSAGRIEDVVREYGLLREALLEVVDASGYEPTTAELRLLLQGLTDAITGAADRHAADRDTKFRDVEEGMRRAAEEYLELGDAFFALDRDFRIVRVNRNQERLSQKPRAETLGRVFWEVWPETADPSTRYWQEYHRVMAERVPSRFEDYFAPLDLWTDVSAYPTRDGGIAVFFRDATPRKRVELALREREDEQRRSWEVNPDLLAVAGLDGYLKRANPALLELLGVSEAELLATPFMELVHPDDRAASKAELERIAQGHRSVRFENRFRRRTGEYVWISWNTAPDPARRTLIAAGRDVTAEKTRSEFEQQLVGIVSHDLRNPLNAILLAAGALTLRADELDVRTLRAVGRIQSSAERAVALTRDLLDFTQARLGGTIPLAPGPADVHEVVRTSIDEVLASFPDRTVRLGVSGDGAGTWDRSRLGQVVSNLVSNALKYGAPGTPVTVTVRGAADEVGINVHNLGLPIPPEELPHLFAPLRRGARQVQSGVGLGLYIVDTIVRAHGGRVEVRSTAEEGTTFEVHLPRHAPPRTR